MPKKQDTTQAVQIAPNVYWVGMHLKDDPFQCHPYLIKNANESILIDPGSMIEFDETVRKVKSIIDIKDIKYIILHHQDPDLAAAVPEIEKLINRDDLLIVTHSRMSLLIKHYLVTSNYYEIDKHDNQLITSSGLQLDFYTTPYCHSPGAFVSYEPNNKLLFSGDIFGGIEESWEFYADESYFDKAKQFHQEYMPSKDIFNYALGKIEKLDINLIAPQHGSIIEKQYIKNLINNMKNLDCGLYIDEKYNLELMNTIKELQDKEKTIKERDLQLLEQSKRVEIGEMIGNIAHQWRQPLAIINSTVGILKEKNSIGLLNKEEIADKLEKMEQRIAYMSDTIEDFMNYYKPNKGSSYFEVQTAIQKAIDILNVSSNEKIKINLFVDSDIKIYGLMNEFVQALVSILSNINDIVNSKNLSDTNITISLLTDENYTTLTIADNCGGIKKENLSKIFDPYFTTKHQAMGTGLGLHIAKMIIEDHMHGSLSARNSNDGAEFIIKLKHGN
ncbi:MAG: ATP-binding protein [Sulfurimonas sp.]|uniref:ATP-binding protein n=1 Tax=Sulfurimonas sp. TaxID=2022749 RepID=UPI00263141E9|nr:ATP-binding protein [Sulfurimonas sp.]MCW8895421.1 ATP-binding protein [Sulfurimonas sp.]MCW8953860.1 ATP-binding protein [Sulfurimonas sp.]MCW9066821.1 ATP-binding protein [Sulfurimonas sp.]